MGNLNVSSSTFTNNTADYGGAIYNDGSYGNANVNITSSTFNNNNADSDGGAIYNDGGTLTVNDSTFTGNTANQYGGAIYNGGTLTVTGSTFTDNHANNNGGAIENFGTASITTCTFNDNTAGFGGAIHNWNGDLAITGSTFSNNDAVYYGGAIHSHHDSIPGTNLTITGSTFTGNNAGISGGAISQTVTPMTITECNFENNHATTGGAIWIQHTMNFIGSTFTGNTAYHGGAIYSSGILTVNGSTFTGNHATGSYPNGYGGAIHSTGNLNVAGSTFTANTAGWAGGAISVVSGALSVTGSTFTENIAGHGGAIYNWYVPIEVHFNRFFNNDATIANAGDAIRTDGTTPSTADAEYNWWGSNDPDFASLISGGADYTPWLFMTLTANPTTIKNTETSQITVSFNNYSSDGITFTPLPNPAAGHIPDGTPVTFNTDLGSIGCKTIEKQTIGGIATAILTADEIAGIAHVNATTDNQTLFVNVTITPKSSLYLTVTPSKAKPVAGDTVVYTLKVGNKGPDTAKDVVMTYVVPEGLEFAGAKVDVGEWTYDPVTRTITWNISEVPKGDPYLWLTLRIAQAGQYLINPILTTSTYDPTLNSEIQSLTVNAAVQTTNVKAASKTIPLRKTGMPLAGLVMAVLAVFGGLVTSKKF